MAIAAAGAIWLRVNILVAVPIVWITNPLTMGPLFYFCYLVGAEMLGRKPKPFNFELSIDWLLGGLLDIWQSFLLGCFTVGSICAQTAFVLLRILWRLHIISHIKDRTRRLHSLRHPDSDKQ